jgi:MoaA/NifB/PqqE/SkfB family radical SAM enzyme
MDVVIMTANKLSSVPTVLNVHLYVTPVCNLKCPHCYYDAFERVAPPPKMLGLDEIAALLHSLADQFDADVHLEGGEPFLRDGIGEVLEGLPEQVLRTLTVTTNGTVRVPMDPEALRGLGALRVSLDGHTDELQQELRGTGLAPVLRTLRRFDADDVPYVVRMTLWRRNAGALASIYRFIEEHGVRRLSLYEFQPSGRGIGTDLLYSVSDRAFEAFLDDLVTLTPPAILESLAVSVSGRRTESVLTRQRRRLLDAGFEVVELPSTASCTINFDGTVGISAWEVTAYGAPDVFTDVSEPTFLDTLVGEVSAGTLVDPSPCTTQVQIRRRW